MESLPAEYIRINSDGTICDLYSVRELPDGSLILRYYKD